MGLTTNFYHRFSSGQTRRIALCPLVCIDALAIAFSELRETLIRVDVDQSYASLFRDSPKFRRQIGDVLTINGMGGWDLPLGDLVSLCIGGDRPPLLGQYNFLVEDFTPQKKGEAIANQGGDFPPRPQSKKMADVFPLFDTTGDLVYPRGVMAADHPEFEATYLALATELQEVESEWMLMHPAIALLWSGEARALALRLIGLFGLNPARLNIHQVCELAIAYQDEPGLLPQLGGLVDTGEKDDNTPGLPMPQTHSALHFMLGALSQSGVRDWRSLIDGMTFPDLESFQHGMAWAADGGKSEQKRRNSKSRMAQFERDFLGGGTPVPDMVEQFRACKRKGIGL